MRPRLSVLACAILIAVAVIALSMRQAHDSALATTALTQAPKTVTVDAATDEAFVTTYPMAASPQRGQVSVLDTRTGAVVTTIATLTNPFATAVDLRARRVVVLNNDSTVSLLAQGGVRVLATIPLKNAALGLTLDASRGHSFVLRSNNTVSSTDVYLFDTRTGRQLRVTTVPVFAVPGVIALDRGDGHILVAGTSGGIGAMSIVDAGTGRLLATRQIPLASMPRALAVDEGLHHAFLADPGGGVVLMLDTRTGGVLHRVAVGAYPQAVAVDAPARRAFVLSVDRAGSGRVGVLDAGSGRLLRATAVGRNPTAIVVDVRHNRVVVTNAGAVDGRFMPVGDGSMSILDATTGGVIRTIPVHGGPVAVGIDEARDRAIVASVVHDRDRGAPLDQMRAIVARLFGQPGGSVGSRRAGDETGSVSLFDLAPY